MLPSLYAYHCKFRLQHCKLYGWVISALRMPLAQSTCSQSCFCRQFTLPLPLLIRIMWYMITFSQWRLTVYSIAVKVGLRYVGALGYTHLWGPTIIFISYRHLPAPRVRCIIRGKILNCKFPSDPHNGIVESHNE